MFERGMFPKSKKDLGTDRKGGDFTNKDCGLTPQYQRVCL